MSLEPFFWTFLLICLLDFFKAAPDGRDHWVGESDYFGFLSKIPICSKWGTCIVFGPKFNKFLKLLWPFLLFLITKFVFIIFISFFFFSFFFWWIAKFSKQNINQSETGIGDQKLSMELYVNKHFAHMWSVGKHVFTKKIVPGDFLGQIHWKCSW